MTPLDSRSRLTSRVAAVVGIGALVAVALAALVAVGMAL